ncbi:MAG: hypothetical protein CL610_19465 [Anaerolineaceae bacterium]|nr:hypothetical protein [Anaerolineaceae bacterium]
MNEFDEFLESLDEMPIHQLEQFNRLLGAVRRESSEFPLTPSQREQRAARIGRAVARLRAGVTDHELELLIRNLKEI